MNVFNFISSTGNSPGTAGNWLLSLLLLPAYSIFSIFVLSLPTIMRESLVGLGHSVYVLALFHRISLARRGVHDFSGEFVDHCLFSSIARISHKPAHRERHAAAGADLNRDLIIRAADALRFDLDLRLEVLDRLLEDL